MKMLSRAGLLVAGMMAFSGFASAKDPAAAPAAAADAAKAAPASTAKVETDAEKQSYTIGFQIATELKSNGLTIDPTAFAAAVADVFAGKAPALNEQQQMEVIQKLREESMKKHEAEMAGMKNKGLEEAAKFLAENKTKEGVKSTESGLQYKVISSGTGTESPKATDKVTVHYTGRLIDGSVFDSSVQRGEPATFGLGQVIKGWTEALQLMKVGDKWEVYIPPDLGYGEAGMGPQIKPNSLLIFEVELISIGDKPADAPADAPKN